ncbi:hypothetical protein LB523_12085 [Mesorhizobium sp. ESP-6-4]|uniref:hypothetical protein n=1 Tax=Mesorhizobium sp. ESP-6-4 TaxID=2876624 RepID=UPI001CCCC4AD|nr:hypothetical protein [Mesorhizobium sp. ESP-6-4]MBZ9659785.1 hypothetical protein [Mesorhizobium sp. ESP-6-4]
MSMTDTDATNAPATNAPAPDLTIVMPFYMNPGMLSIQYAKWAAWPEEIKDRIAIILVDDGSPVGHAIDVPRPECLPALSIYRVLEDRPWHQHAARNLGAYVAGEGWLLLTDMDHVLAEEDAAALLKRIGLGKLDTGTVYMLNRIEADTGLQTLQNGFAKPHPNSFVLTREAFWRIGGYDEDFCGVYGTDGLFRARAFANAKQGHLDKVSLTRYWRDLVEDASTTTLLRKDGRDPLAKHRIMEAKRTRGEQDVVKVLQFPWERVF